MVLGEGDYASGALLRRAAQARSFAFRPASLEQPIYAGDVITAIGQAATLKYAGGLDLAGAESLSRRALLQRARHKAWVKVRRWWDCRLPLVTPWLQ